MENRKQKKLYKQYKDYNKSELICLERHFYYLRVEKLITTSPSLCQAKEKKKLLYK